MEDEARKLEPPKLPSLDDGAEFRSSGPPASVPPPRASFPRRVWRRIVTLQRSTMIGLAVLALVLLGVRIALPFVVKHFINERLAQLEGHSGHVEDVDISLIRAAYAVDRLRIVTTEGDVPVPFVSVRRIDLSVDWSELC